MNTDHPRLEFSLVFRERANVVHHVPTLFFSHALLPRRHDPGYAFRDLPKELTVSHRRHPFLVREVRRLAPQLRQIRFVTCTSLTVTKHTVAFHSIHIELFALGNRFRRHSHRILRVSSVLWQLPRVLREIRLRLAAVLVLIRRRRG